MRTVVLLILSNTFMTIAWYGHLKYKAVPLLITIALSWLIALPEYALQVPANRFGHGQFTAPQLKIIQEAISITVFVVFSVLYLRESPNWRTGLAMLLILAAVALAVLPGGSESSQAEEASRGQSGVSDEDVVVSAVKGPGSGVLSSSQV
jgi:uncharacterized protein (DUF486 family)